MKSPLLLLAAGLSAAALAQPTPPAARPAIDTHGVDLRTQAGPPGPEKYSPPFPVDPKLPTLWVIGDSTVRNGSAGNGTNLNQWGWGAPLTFYFDPAKVNVVNRALGGTSARSFSGAEWPRMVDLIKPGDVVIMQFGTNDGGNPGRSVGELRGLGDETETITNRRTGQPETIHSYGWYLRQLIAGTRARGATPVVCSLIPRRRWEADGRIQRDHDTFAGWAEQVARSEHVGFVDLNELSARRLDRLGKAETTKLYVPNPTPERPRGESVHTGWDGAAMNAECVVAGLKALPDDPVAAWFSSRGRAIPPATAP